MAKSTNQKLKIFYLKEILLEHTDKFHYLSMAEIIELLNSRNIKAERKSIYSDIELLRELGLEIVNHKRLGYAVVKRDFDISDVEAIVKGLNQIEIIDSQKQYIISKLKSMLSIHDIELLN